MFDGLSLKAAWDQVVVEEIGGCDPLERLQYYLGDTVGSPGMETLG